jgi:predicted nucleic acid-binding protein
LITSSRTGIICLPWRSALSAYDAAYLQLALRNAAALVTLDARLAAAWDNAMAAK